MNETVFRLTAADLGAYQLAVRDRLNGMAPQLWWENAIVRWAALALACALVVFIAAGLIEWLLERPMEFAEFAVGVTVGIAGMAAVIWVTYQDQKRRLAKPDGPILDRQTLRLSNDGISVGSKHVEARYAWAVVEDVTEAHGLVILWIEPGAGVAVPAHAFNSDNERAEFLRAIEARRSASGLPRGGSFG